MATHKETLQTYLEHLGNENLFSARPMFGEYGLYAAGKIVALICEDTLFVKILPSSLALSKACKPAPPYRSAKDHYAVPIKLLPKIPDLAEILLAISATLPDKKPTPKKSKQ